MGRSIISSINSDNPGSNYTQNTASSTVDNFSTSYNNSNKNIEEISNINNINNNIPNNINYLPNGMVYYPNNMNYMPNGGYYYPMPNGMPNYPNNMNYMPNGMVYYQNGFMPNGGYYYPMPNGMPNYPSNIPNNIPDNTNNTYNQPNENINTNEDVQENNNQNVESKVQHYNSNRKIGDVFISFKNVVKKYTPDLISIGTVALNDVSFDINEGELVIFLGHSGAGKTTALNMLGGMDSVTSGSVVVGSREITNYSLDELTEYRKNDIGFIFQSYNLIQNLTVKENIDLSTQIKNERVDASIILDKVGLKSKLNNYPAELSGGEQQRVAIARAIAKKPKILLCDEPTGALDFATGNQILSLIQKTCYEEGVTTIIITHNQQIAGMADKIIRFNSGKVTDVIINEHPLNVEDIKW